MTPSLGRLTVSPTAIVVGLGYLAGAILLASLPVRSVPNLHAVLDTSSMLLCGLLAWLLWDMGARLENRLPRWLAATFALTAIGELVHVLVTVEWTGALAPVARSVGRPSADHLAAGRVPAADWHRHQRLASSAARRVAGRVRRDTPRDPRRAGSGRIRRPTVRRRGSSGSRARCCSGCRSPF